MFDDVLTALSDAHVRFIVTGGVAVVFHGYQRSVPDLDLVVDLSTPDSAEAAASCLGRLGFVATLPLPLHSVVVMRFFDGQGREVDLNVRYSIPFADLMARATMFSIDGRSVPVISMPDLLAVKVARGRDYDVEDVSKLRAL